MDTNPNQLCFVCHANDTSSEGHRFTDMKSEFNTAGKQCVDCHMGERKMGIASTLPGAGGKPTKRLIRDHGFIGAHTEGMWKDALQVKALRGAKGVEITLTNPQPHALPSGFGSREIVIDAQFVSGGKVLKTESLSLSSHFVNKRGKPTIPHLSAKTVSAVSIPSHGSKTFTIPLTAGAESVHIGVSYRLVNDEVREMLKLKDPIWSKKMVIKKLNLKL
jgi:hypothetical protein